jgi:hypothetical protein
MNVGEKPEKFPKQTVDNPTNVGIWRQGQQLGITASLWTCNCFKPKCFRKHVQQANTRQLEKTTRFLWLCPTRILHENRFTITCHSTIMQATELHLLFRRKSERLHHCLFAIENLHDFATTISPLIIRVHRITGTPTACAPHKVHGVPFSVSRLR